MTNREIIQDLVRKEMEKLEKQDCARPFDGYESGREEQIEGFKRYMKLKDIMRYLKMKDWKPSRMTTKLMKETLDRVPDWKEILQELIEKEMKELESYDCARPYDGHDADKEEQNKVFNKYKQLEKMGEKLKREKQKGETKQTLFDRLRNQPPKTFLDSDGR